jgi:hypothetical protein
MGFLHGSIRAGVIIAPAVALALAGLTTPLQAANSSFTGIFATDDELATFLIDLPAAGDITALTLSYSGGPNGIGQAIPAVGFAPVLTLFDGVGNDVYGNSGSGNICQGGGSFCWDASFSYIGAPAGHYTLVLSQDGNTPLGQLAEGFSMTGQPHYTAQFLGSPGNPNATFIQIDGAQRSGHWALDLTVPNGASVVPEPDAATLLVAGLAIAGLARRRARLSTTH